MATAAQHQRGGYKAEYAPTSRASCSRCGKAIKQDTVKIGKEVRSEYHDGWDTQWSHVNCSHPPSFSAIKEAESLRYEDQVALRKACGEAIPNNEDEKNKKKRMDELWQMIDDLGENTKKPELKVMLEENGIEIGKSTPASIAMKCADGMLWGLIGPCPECKNAGSLRFGGSEYFCKTGWISEYTRCEWRGKEAQRFKWKIPKDKVKSEFLVKWKPSDSHPKNYLGETKKEGEEAKEEEEEEEIEEDQSKEDEVPENQEFYGINVMIAGTKKDLGTSQDELADLITEHGGRVDDSLESDTTVLVAPEAELKKRTKTKKIKDALKKQILVLSPEWVQNLAARTEEGIKLRSAEAAKAYWVGEGNTDDAKVVSKIYLKARVEKEAAKEAAEEAAEKEEEAKAEAEALPIKKRKEPKKGSDILKVDPISGKHSGDILVTEDDDYGFTPYNVMMNQTDIATGGNKFYKMQIIQVKKTYFFFISWGRVGVSGMGGNKVYEYKSMNKAIEAFAQKFYDCTGTVWEERTNFKKKPGRYAVSELDDGNEEEEEGEPTSKRPKLEEKSEEVKKEDKKEALPARVKTLVSEIFDTNMMKKALESLDVDVKKMPLGKISKSQIKQGYQVLTDIQNVLQNEGTNPSEMRLKDLSNQFYTIIPHNFGMNAVPIIRTIEDVKKKTDLVDALCDIEIANKLMKETKETSSEDDALVGNYNALKAKITPLDKSGELYKRLSSYAYNSHDDKYFSNFGFEVEDIFEVDREGEEQRFDPWKDNHNRKLLWHGSRLTNWVGIISNGLRIAPPEAPASGYRFGKGIYFADIISKSGSYCATSNNAPQAVMMLAEVALGVQNELKQDKYMEKAPAGTDCTKALGKTEPDKKSDYKTENGVVIPLGKPINTKVSSSCSHNEYIVYDVSQVRARYLLRLKFNHKGFSW
eukprot:TRINITY_DN2453_c1_g2_i1.p1 TRINITY_DN2453_c1_g2~~TRINITY_DN2453_c1_g2_i1.p1  ORF type:complete len:925 (-),score=400.89 TRINITY_DN2453_c1_g2_i1:130-2904(-)